MNAVGIDVSKGKSMVCVMRPFGEIMTSPYEVDHTVVELSKLADSLKNLTGETKVIMECTGSYHLPIANALHEAGLTVCTVHAQLIHDFGNNTIRKVKTDKAQAVIQTNAVAESLTIIACEMKKLAMQLPEYTVVREFRGVGDVLCPQLIAEVGDIYRFSRKQSLVCFAGLEPENSQSGKYSADGEVSKKGSPHLRKALFQVVDCLLKHSPTDDPIYQFLDRKCYRRAPMPRNHRVEMSMNCRKWCPETNGTHFSHMLGISAQQNERIHAFVLTGHKRPADGDERNI